MQTTRLLSQGQVILPESIRLAHHWEPGVELMIEDTGEGVLLRSTRPFQPTRLEDVIGCTGYRGPKKTLEDMDAAIAAGVKAQHDRKGMDFADALHLASVRGADAFATFDIRLKKRAGSHANVQLL